MPLARNHMIDSSPNALNRDRLVLMLCVCVCVCVYIYIERERDTVFTVCKSVVKCD